MIHHPPAARPRNARKPRASGDDPPGESVACPRDHVNPARAGMIPLHNFWDEHLLRKPRASGDDPPGKIIDANNME